MESRPLSKTPDILIIGAGVIGLSTGILLQESYPNTSITIIAAETPWTANPSADYASMWAGAHYRPIPRSTRQLDHEADMGLKTAVRMRDIAQRNPEAGVAFMVGIEYLDVPPKEILALKTGDEYAGPGDGFRVLDQTELPVGVKWGCEYEAYCMNVPVYARWLLDLFLSRGGKVTDRRLTGVQEAFSSEFWGDSSKKRLVVNCSGRNFDTDPKVKPIRGQTVLVRQQYSKHITRQLADGTWFAIIPRSRDGGTVIGVTKEMDDSETKARPESRRKLLEAAVKHCPDFVDSVENFDVVQDNVGRRPWREGGFRIEKEDVTSGGVVVHGYGAGGRGYELSWGAAGEIVDLVKKEMPARAVL